MDRLEAMEILLAVVDLGSLSAAARRLGLPLTTVSRKIAALERHLKTPLLVRGSRHSQLTEAGRAYAASCRGILEELAETERLAAGEFISPKGSLAISAPIVFGRLHLLPIVTEFLRAHTAINIRLMLADRIVSLPEEHVDLALRIGMLSDNSLVALKVGTIRRVVCASPGYLSERGLPQHPSDLTSHDCVAFENLGVSPQWTFYENRQQVPVAIRPRLIVNTAEAAVDAAVSGLGFTRLLSYQIALATRAGKLRVVLQDYEPPPLPVSLVHVQAGSLPLKTRAFLDFAAPRLRSAIAVIPG